MRRVGFLLLIIAVLFVFPALAKVGLDYSGKKEVALLKQTREVKRINKVKAEYGDLSQFQLSKKVLPPEKSDVVLYEGVSIYQQVPKRKTSLVPVAPKPPRVMPESVKSLGFMKRNAEIKRIQDISKSQK